MKLYFNPDLLFSKLSAFFGEVFKPKQKFVYVALGDSTVEGIGATDPDRSFPSLVYAALKSQYKGATFHNLGKSGAKIKDVIENQLERAIELQPDLVTISVGANDLRARTKMSAFSNDLNYLIESLKERTEAKIIMNNVPDFSTLPSIPFAVRIFVRLFVKKINDVIAEVADKTGAILVDLYNGSKEFTKRYPELISSDGFHPSDVGYALWATAIITQIKAVFSSHPPHIVKPAKSF